MIKQGDEYFLRVKIKSGDVYVTDEDVEKVEIAVCGVIKTYPDEVEWDAKTGEFLYPVKQEESLKFRPDATVPLDLRVKFKSGDVCGIIPQKINVVRSESKAVL